MVKDIHDSHGTYFSGTKVRVDLKPGCKFKFFCRKKVYVKKNDQFGPWKAPGAIFFTKGPLKSASESQLWVYLGVQVQEGPLRPHNEQQ